MNQKREGWAMTEPRLMPPLAVDYSAIRDRISDEGATALDVAQAASIALPKVLRLMGISGGPRRAADELTGFEAVRLCAMLDVPLSAIVRGEGL